MKECGGCGVLDGSDCGADAGSTFRSGGADC